MYHIIAGRAVLYVVLHVVWNILKSKNVHMCYCWCTALYLEATFFDNGLRSESALISHYQIFWRPNKDKMSCLARVNWKNPIQSYVWEYSMLYEIIKGFKTNLMQERLNSTIKNCSGRKLITDTHHIVSQLVTVLQTYSN